jgi:hypothetical protein
VLREELSDRRRRHQRDAERDPTDRFDPNANLTGQGE